MRLLLLLFLTLNLLNAQKLALLIGNSQYTHLDKLSSPPKDIPALAKKLRGMNFEVTELYDLDEKAMKQAIKNFKKRLEKNPNAIALFYYSGHGSQAYGESYLIPIDGDTRDEADVEADGLKVETIAQKMAHARTKANILFLDACRDVPTGEMGGTKGLGQVKHRPSGSLIVYSTSKNTTAKDDRLFNKVVLEKLATNVPLTTLANDISYSVDQKTDGKQVPEVFVKSLPMICLSGKCSNNSKYSMQNITIVDGLMYQNQPFKWFTPYKGKKYCEKLSLGGYDDWRLPTIIELVKISNLDKMYDDINGDESTWKNLQRWVNDNKYKRIKGSSGTSFFIKKEFIENIEIVKDSTFWGQSCQYYRNGDSSCSYHLVDFSDGAVVDDMNDEHSILCVRGKPKYYFRQGDNLGNYLLKIE